MIVHFSFVRYFCAPFHFVLPSVCSKYCYMPISQLRKLGPENSHHGHTAPDEAGQVGGSPRRELPAAMPRWDGCSRGCQVRGSCAAGQRGHPPPASLPCMLPTSLVFKGRRAGEGPGPCELHQRPEFRAPLVTGGATSGRLSVPGPPGDAPVPCRRRRSIASSWHSVCSLPALLLRWHGCPQSCLPHHSQGPARCPRGTDARSV